MNNIIIILLIIIFYLLFSQKNEKFSNDKIVKNNIYVFWTGTNRMNQNRLDGIESMKKITEVNVTLINVQNLDKYILPNYPLHLGYKYLSRVQKSDYLRCYFMHHYGGGYADIKRQTGSWKKFFDQINNDKNIWMIGLGGFNPPSKAFGIAYPEEYNQKQRDRLTKYHNKMVLKKERLHCFQHL